MADLHPDGFDTPRPDLESHLESVALHIAAGAPEGADLAAMLPCDLAVGEVVAVCWRVGGDASGAAGGDTGADEPGAAGDASGAAGGDTGADEPGAAGDASGAAGGDTGAAGDGPGSDAGEPTLLWELVRLADGERLSDDAALREALTLSAMAESVEALADPAVLAAAGHAIRGWVAEAGDAGVPDALFAALDANLARLDDLARAVRPAPRVASPRDLDAIGGLLRELDRQWLVTERAAERWSQTAFDDHHESVQALWRALGVGRSGPLAVPVGVALEQGREAGLALAAEVAAGAH